MSENGRMGIIINLLGITLQPKDRGMGPMLLLPPGYIDHASSHLLGAGTMAKLLQFFQNNRQNNRQNKQGPNGPPIRLQV
jgi:hypothetical protein